MREKVTASLIFRDRKASYPKSVAHPFRGDYIRLRQNGKWNKTATDLGDQYVVFADIINKITRSNGKVSWYALWATSGCVTARFDLLFCLLI